MLEVTVSCFLGSFLSLDLSLETDLDELSGSLGSLGRLAVVPVLMFACSV